MGRKSLGGMRGLDSWFGVARRHRCAGVGRPVSTYGYCLVCRPANIIRLLFMCSIVALLFLIIAMAFPLLPEGAYANESATMTSVDTGAIAMPRATTSVGLAVPASIDFADITVAPDDSTTTASATVNVTTTGSSGYKLYLYTKDNSLRSRNPNITETITAASAQSLDDFDSNTWGYNLTAGTTAGTTFSPLPTDDATPVVDKDTGSSGNAANDIYTLSFGAKIDSVAPSGTYAGTLTLSVVAEPALVTVVFDGNGATSGSMDSFQILPGDSQILPKNTFARTYYDFLGWGTVADDDSYRYSDGDTYRAPTDAAGDTITLYAKWKRQFVNLLTEVTYMQDLTATQCFESSDGAKATLIDRRDNNSYNVAKINGTCWMTQNLRLSGGRTLTSTDSNLPEGVAYVMPEDSSDWAYDPPYGQLHAGEAVGDNSAIDTGHWYNFCAASAGELCNPPQAQHATQDICPKGWRLPDGTEAIYDTKYLAAFATVTGGYYRYTDEFEDTDQGFWWLSSARTGSSQYMLHYDGSQLTRMYGSVVGGRELGYYIRCIRPSDD